MDGKGHPGIGAVDGGGGGEDQVLHPAVPAAFKDVDETYQVAVDVGVGIFQGVAHPGLGGQVDHLGKPLGGEQSRDPGTVRQVHPGKAKVGVSHELRQTSLLEADVVVVVEVVEPDDFIATVEQAFRQVIPDEASSAGYQQLCHSKNPS
jgi:hypothetical protein